MQVSETANTAYGASWVSAGPSLSYGVCGFKNVPGTFALMEDRHANSSLFHHAIQTVPSPAVDRHS